MKIVYNVEKCKESITALVSCYDELLEYNQSICNELSILCEGWEGEAANAFKVKAVQTTQSFLEALSAMNTCLEDVIEIYALHEESKDLVKAKFKEKK